MFKIESNIQEVINSQLNKLDQLIEADKVLRQAAFDTVALVSDRVQQQGALTDGQKMITSSPKKFGSYSKKYGQKRSNKGLQTEIIDQTYSGDMMGDLLPEPEDKTSYVVGFRGEKSSATAQYNEERFGTIFQLSSSELSVVNGIVKDSINEILNS